MRLSGPEAGPARAEGGGPRGGFDQALREAERRGAERAGARRGAAATSSGPEASHPAAGGPGRRATGAAAEAGELAAGAPGGLPGPAAPALLQGGPAPGPPPPLAATLAQALRSVPPAVEALRRGDREVLALDFGRALGVEVREAPGGVVLTLAAAPGLLSAARAALPGLARALAARGVAVVRAEVRARPDGGRGR